jgi:hypothetical protein
MPQCSQLRLPPKPRNFFYLLVSWFALRRVNATTTTTLPPATGAKKEQADADLQPQLVHLVRLQGERIYITLRQGNHYLLKPILHNTFSHAKKHKYLILEDL